MSFNLKSNTFENSIITTDELVAPIGSNLANPALYNKVPFPGALGYDKTNQAFYYGDGVIWKNDGSIGGLGFTGNSGPTGLGSTGMSGQTGLGSTGSTGSFTIGGTGSAGIMGQGSTGADGGVGNTGATGSPGSQSTADYIFVSKEITSEQLTLAVNDPIPFDAFKQGGTLTWNGGPTYTVSVGTTGYYIINYGYGNIQGKGQSEVPQSFSLANNGVSYGASFTMQELFDTGSVLSETALSVKGQSGNVIRLLNAGDRISVINTITNNSNLPRVFQNKVFNIGASTSGSLAGWLTMVKIG